MTTLTILAVIGWLLMLTSVVVVTRRHLQDTATISQRYRSWRYHCALRAQARRRRRRPHVHRFVDSERTEYGWMIITCVTCGHEELK